MIEVAIMGGNKVFSERLLVGFRSCMKIILGITALNCVFCKHVSADAAYVYKMPDGSIRITGRRPAHGTQAKVYTARGRVYDLERESRGSGFARVDQFSSMIRSSARKYQIDPNLVAAVIFVESAFNPNAVSPKGAQGLMQLMPEKSMELGVRNPFIPQQNVDAGSRLLSNLIARYAGNIEFALAAYNAGESAVDRHGGIPPYRETQQYVRRVLEYLDKFRLG